MTELGNDDWSGFSRRVSLMPMTTITLTPELEAWAREEVASGCAQSIEHAVRRAIAGYSAQMDAFRRTLDEAELEAEREREGGLDAEAVFAELKARYAARA